MTTEKPENQSSAVRAFILLVNISLIFAVSGFFLSAIFTPLGLAGVIKDNNAPIVTAGIYFCGFLTSAVYLWIIHFLRQLMLSVRANNPFDLKNPGRIRKIAYAVFALVPVDISGNMLMKGLQTTLNTANFVDLLWGSLFKLTFLGFGLLVIAKVFDLGVELQREQKMTI
jgi:hypothetical protein